MADGKRPGGLTTLAVLNFVFGGLAVFRVIGKWGAQALTSAMVSSANSEAGRAMKATFTAGQMYAQLALMIVSAILLIVAGVGYMGQRRFLGRTMGTAYAIVSIASSVFGVVVLNEDFDIFTIIGVVFPVLTLILVNTTFKDDLVN